MILYIKANAERILLKRSIVSTLSIFSILSSCQHGDIIMERKHQNMSQALDINATLLLSGGEIPHDDN